MSQVLKLLSYFLWIKLILNKNTYLEMGKRWNVKEFIIFIAVICFERDTANILRKVLRTKETDFNLFLLFHKTNVFNMRRRIAKASKVLLIPSS